MNPMTARGLGDVSPEAWRRLYETVVAMDEAKPWQWVTVDKTFAVQLPDSGEVYYCVLMGAPELRGVKMHPGPIGYAALQALRQGVLEDIEDAGFGTRSLMVYFGSREQLDKQERAMLRHLGFRFRGPTQWPAVRSFREGQHPAIVSPDEVPIVITVMEQAMALAEDVRENPRLFELGGQGQVVTRMVRPDTGEWVTAWTALPQELPSLFYQPVIDEVRAARLRRDLPASSMWGVEARYARFCVQDGQDAPITHPPTLLCLDLVHGIILKYHIAEEPTDWQSLADAMLDLVQELGRRPKVLVVRTPRAGALMEPVAQALGCMFVEDPDADVLNDAWTTMADEVAK